MDNEQLKNRLRQLERQVNGVLNMMEQEKDCRDVVTQLTAASSAIDHVISVMVSMNLEYCVRESMKNVKETEFLVKEAIDLLVKSR